MKERLGLIRDNKDKRDFSVGRLLHPRMQLKLPAKVDYTSEMSDVRDQGDFRSCVAFATCAVREWQEQKEYEREKQAGSEYEREEPYYDLSEMWCYWHCKEIDPWPDQQGTSIRAAMKVFHTIGCPEEEAWPYEAVDEPKDAPKGYAEMTARWKLIDSYYRISGLQRIKETLHNFGPFVLGVYVFSSFSEDTNGVIPMPAEHEYPIGGHAVAVVGYNDKTKQLKFKNSWGSWGDHGYGYLPYEYEEFFLDAWVPVDKDVKHAALFGEAPRLTTEDVYPTKDPSGEHGYGSYK